MSDERVDVDALLYEAERIAAIRDCGAGALKSNTIRDLVGFIREQGSRDSTTTFHGNVVALLREADRRCNPESIPAIPVTDPCHWHSDRLAATLAAALRVEQVAHQATRAGYEQETAIQHDALMRARAELAAARARIAEIEEHVTALCSFIKQGKA